MLACSLLIGSLSNLQVSRTSIKSQTSSNSGQIRPVLLELVALDCCKRSYMTLFRHSPFIFIWPLWNLQISWAGIKSHLCSKFGQSGLFTLELPAWITRNTIFYFLGMLDSGEQSLPFGRLFSNCYQCSKFFIDMYQVSDCNALNMWMLAHLSLQAHWWAYSMCRLRRPSVVSPPVVHIFQTSSQKPLGRSKPHFMWNLSWMGIRNFVQMPIYCGKNI